MEQKSCHVICGEDKIVCHCFGIGEEALIEITRLKKITSLWELREETEAGSGCSACHRKLKQIIQTHGEAT